MADSFHQDLSIGHEAEIHVLHQIRAKYRGAVQIKVKFSGYDIWIPETSQGVEVKFVKASNLTGNFIFELEANHKPSGIMPSKAYWWVIYDGDETYYIEKDKMLKLLIMANVNWTDLNNSSGEYRKVIFLPTKYYKRYFKSNLY